MPNNRLPAARLHLVSPPAKEQIPPRDKLLKELDPTITDIRKTVNGMRKASIAGFHAIGRILLRDKERITQADNTRRIYQLGKSTLAVIEQAVGIAPSTLSKCRKFAELYDQAQLDALLERSVSWGHLRNILTLNTEIQRQEFLDRVERDNLTESELVDAIYRKYGQQKPGAGRTSKPPPNVKKALFRLYDWIQKSHRRTLNVLFDSNSGEYDLPNEILNQAPEELTEEQFDSTAASINELRNLGRAALSAAVRLEKTLPFYHRVFADRAKQDDIADAEE